MKTKNPNALRYTFSVNSIDGDFYMDGFKDYRSAADYRDRIRRTSKKPDNHFFVLRETYRENKFVRSAPEITVRAVLADHSEILEKVYFCSPAQAVEAMRRSILWRGPVESITIVRAYVQRWW